MSIEVKKFSEAIGYREINKIIILCEQYNMTNKLRRKK